MDATAKRTPQSPMKGRQQQQQAGDFQQTISNQKATANGSNISRSSSSSSVASSLTNQLLSTNNTSCNDSAGQVYRSPRKPMSAVATTNPTADSYLSPRAPRPSDRFRRSGGQFQALNQSATRTSATQMLATMSPLKCLNNLADPSPTKKLPTLLRNPFNQPGGVKRKLDLYSPRKQTHHNHNDNNGSSNHSGNSALARSMMRSPNKKTKMLELDEDANLEAPRLKMTNNNSLTPRKRARLNISHQPCYQNDWTLRTKVRINFEKQCKNWDQCSTSTHKRNRVGAIVTSYIEESPSKLNDKSISIEAIKNIATVYQHPYLAWLPVYPRHASEFNTKRENPFTLTKHSDIAKMMLKDWCESLGDLVNLLIDGKCPYFYMCSDNYNILFKQVPTSDPKKPLVQACVAPFSYGMGCELNKCGVEFKCPDIARNNSSNAIAAMERENSQRSFGSQLSQSRSIILDDADCTDSQASRPASQAKIPSSIDSGNVSDFDDDEDFGDDENEDASIILESLGISQQDFPSLQTRRKGFIEIDSNNTQSKSTSNKPLATIEGIDNIRKLVKFLQTNRLYTVSNVGKFACIPPTLLSPREFRLSTPQYPEVILSKNMIEAASQIENKQRLGATKSKNLTPKKTDPAAAAAAAAKLSLGPTFVELKGTILPNLYKELHKLLAASDNMGHSCLSTKLDSSIPFGTVQFT